MTQSCIDVAVCGKKIFVTVGSNDELVVLDGDTRQLDMVVPLGDQAGDGLGRLGYSDRHLYICVGGLRQIVVVDLQ